MKKIYYILSAALVAAVCSCSADLGGRIDQRADVAIPAPISVKSVDPISGGAIIKVTIPDDENLKGVVAEYDRNGETVNYKISRYVDSLRVEGFADLKEHVVNLYSFNVNEERSEPVQVRFTPLEAAVHTVQASLAESFGGVKIHIENNLEKSSIAACLLRCDKPEDFSKPVSKIRWVEVTTLFTASQDIFLSRRGLEPVEAIYGVYLRDHWGNMSDTLTAVLTPLPEVKLDPSKFKNARIADDNCTSQNASNYPVEALWDGSGQSSIPHFFVSAEGGGSPSPCWLTIDLGVIARLSRITTLPRIGYLPFSGGAVRNYEFWGSMAPTGVSVEKTEDNPYGFDDTWFKLGEFIQAKPSGYDDQGLPGDTTAEDIQVFNAGNDFEFDPGLCPKCNDELRYLRVVFVHTFTTFEFGHGTSNTSIQTGEITPFGQIVSEL